MHATVHVARHNPQKRLKRKNFDWSRLSPRSRSFITVHYLARVRQTCAEGQPNTQQPSKFDLNSSHKIRKKRLSSSCRKDQKKELPVATKNLPKVSQRYLLLCVFCFCHGGISELSMVKMPEECLFSVDFTRWSVLFRWRTIHLTAIPRLLRVLFRLPQYYRMRKIPVHVGNFVETSKNLEFRIATSKRNERQWMVVVVVVLEPHTMDKKDLHANSAQEHFIFFQWTDIPTT